MCYIHTSLLTRHYPACRRMLLLLFPFLLLPGFTVVGQQPLAAKMAVLKTSHATRSYLTIEAQSGDDVPKLLARYNLDAYDCNISEFFSINGLKEDYRLKAGLQYKLPVLLVEYNGKTIRSTLDLEDWQTAIRINDFNKAAQAGGLRARSFIEDKELWVPWHELNCPAEGEVAAAAEEVAAAKSSGKVSLKEATASAGNRIFPIFGKKYQKTPLASNRLRGKVFYVISGHGGPDVGAEGKRAGHTLCEDEYAYDVALRLVRLLVSHGATAYMIVRDPDDGIRDDTYLPCDKDEYVWGDQTIPLDQKQRLAQRTDLINQMTERYLKAGVKDQTIIEIHVDSRHRKQEIDVFFYYRPDSEPSKELALDMHKKFLEKYTRLRSQKQYKGTVTPRSLFTLRETTTPVAVYVELGNIRNSWDQQRVVLSNNRQALANWLFDALK
ncbi:MAG: N-acetylmuramoyl-L-alanine amidase [Bacteroidetes bacterium]|nr:MAG: N-acetylmuramoyl-L-alanine amidase [Bacteroidota bacterium]